MKCALLQLRNEQIVIVDNSTHIGKGRVEHLCNNDAEPVGIIESDLRPAVLKQGFEKSMREEYEEQRYQVCLAREALNGDIQWEQVHPPEPEGADT
jgi:hypothetical protein